MTVDFPHPIGPVTPISVRSSPAHACSILELEPGLFGGDQRLLDVGQLARDAPQLDEVRTDGRVAHRQLEVVLPQSEPGELAFHGGHLTAVEVLGELRLLRRAGSAGRSSSRLRAIELGRRRWRDAYGCSRSRSPPRSKPTGLALRRIRDRPAGRDRRPPLPVATVEGHSQAVVDDPQPITHGLEQSPVVRDDEQGCGRLGQERLDRLAGRDVEVVRRLVEQEQVRRQDPEQRQLEPRALAARKRSNFLERIVAAEQEPRQVPARLAGRDRDRVEDRIEDGRAGNGGAAQLGEIPDLDGVAEGEHPVEGRQVARDRAQQRRLPGAVRPDDPDPLATLRSKEWRVGDFVGPALRTARAPQVADDGALKPDHELTRPGRPAAAGERRGRQGQLAALLRRSHAVRLEPLQARLVLVHLRELAVAPVALDELSLALDRTGLGLDVLLEPRISFDALPVIGAVVAPERRQPAIAQLPDAGHDRIEEGAVMRRDEQRSRPAAEMLLQPLERPDVEVVRRLVEQEQVGVGDHEAGEGGPGLLPARQRGWWLRPFVPAEPEPGQRLVDPLVERVATQDLEPVLEVGVGVLGHAVVALVGGELLGHPLEMRRTVPDRAPKIGCRHERGVEMGLLGEHAERHAPLAGHLATIGLVQPRGDPEQRRLAGAVRPDEPDPVADRH